MNRLENHWTGPARHWTGLKTTEPVWKHIEPVWKQAEPVTKQQEPEENIPKIPRKLPEPDPKENRDYTIPNLEEDSLIPATD